MQLSVANQDRVLPETVALYCAKHQLLPELQTAIRLAELHFHPVSDLRVGVETDPDPHELPLFMRGGDGCGAMDLDSQELGARILIEVQLQ